MEFNLRIEFNEGGTDSNAEKAITAFESFHPAASRSQLGRLEVVLTVQAEDVGQAAVLGYKLGLHYPKTITALEVLRTEDFDRLVGLAPLPDLVNAAQAAEILEISAAAVGQKFAAGELPGKRVGERTLVFARQDIEAAALRRAMPHDPLPGESNEEHVERVTRDVNTDYSRA